MFTKPQKKSQKDGEKSGAQPGQPHMAKSWGDDGLEDAEGMAEKATSESLGFHGSKKRSRKNIRPKNMKKRKRTLHKECWGWGMSKYNLICCGVTLKAIMKHNIV